MCYSLTYENYYSAHSFKKSDHAQIHASPTKDVLFFLSYFLFFKISVLIVDAKYYQSPKYK